MSKKNFKYDIFNGSEIENGEVYSQKEITQKGYIIVERYSDCAGVYHRGSKRLYKTEIANKYGDMRIVKEIKFEQCEDDEDCTCSKSPCLSFLGTGNSGLTYKRCH